MTIVEKSGMPYPKGYPIIMTGAGLCKTFNPTRISEYARAADFAVIGSITVNPRRGNDGVKEWLDDPLFGLNAWGMPNEGLASRVEPGYDNVIASIAGFSPEEYWELAESLADYSAGVEINLGCPNAGHPIPSYHPQGIADIFECIAVSKGLIGVKLSPILDSGMLKEVAAVLADTPIDYVATCNTIPGGAGRLSDEWMIDTAETGNLGGISGKPLNPVSLGQAIQLRKVLPDTIDVIRVGGIETGKDVLDSMFVGCAGVQLVTHVAQISTAEIYEIRREYADLVG
jgi:dihydroorotate dehydrogenase|tara:strand:+ start:183 stop:1040 length:858 start_codon:yes stop_codon:yes gene_type:complete